MSHDHYNFVIHQGWYLGGTFDMGINWLWFHFETEQAAQEFEHYCQQNHFETRGVYEPHHDNTWGVRFR